MSDESVVLPCTKLLSRINEGQAVELRELESNYEEVLDENCRILVKYFTEVLENADGDELITPPPLTSTKHGNVDNLIKQHEDEEITTEELEYESELHKVMLCFSFICSSNYFLTI